MSFTDEELDDRGAATLLASWEAYAGGSPGAELHRLPGVAVGVFRREPERSFYNNALLHRGLSGAALAAAADAVAATYAAGGIDDYAVWVHERDEEAVAAFEARGYRVDQTTRAMGMDLADLREPEVTVDLAPPDWAEYVRVLGLDESYLSADTSPYRVVIGLLEGESVAAAMAFEHDGDCGIFNVTTHEPARRRGLGTALTTLLLQEARDRGCRTASLQSTPMAERVYAAIGFRDLGRYVELVP